MLNTSLFVGFVAVQTIILKNISASIKFFTIFLTLWYLENDKNDKGSDPVLTGYFLTQPDEIF